MYSYFPKMYFISQKNKLFTVLVFLSWFILGSLQGVYCILITIYALGTEVDASGYSSYQSGYYFT